MKILIVTDAWYPQVNGVVTTLEQTIKHIQKENEIYIIHPNSEEIKKNTKCPFYPEIDIALKFNKEKIIEKLLWADSIHISTETSIGYYVSRLCRKLKLRYTTSFHTNFHKAVYYPFNKAIEKYLSFFHKGSSKIYSASKVVDKEIKKVNKILENKIVRWSRGIDKNIFYYDPSKKIKNNNDEKYLLYVGRISKEKNIEEFLEMANYNKVVVGDGPMLEIYKKNYPNVKFLGYKKGKELADIYRDALYFVFPSTFDTFGLVLLEAMACGTPVIAKDCQSNRFLVNNKNGYLVDNLKHFTITEEHIVEYNDKSKEAKLTADKFSWKKASQQFIDNLVKK